MRSIGLAAVTLQGFIDAIERGVVYGWAWNPRQPMERVDVEILHGETQLTTVRADLFRDDLVDLEIGDGQHAFEYTLPEELIGRIDPAEIEVRFAGSEVPLPRMQVRPQRRDRPDGPPRPDAEMIASLQERIAMQERVIADMSNLLRGLVERLQDLSPHEEKLDSTPQAESLSAAIGNQTKILQGMEIYLATFGQSLRDLSDRLPSEPSDKGKTGSRIRVMDLFFLLLIAGAIIWFVLGLGYFN